MHTCTFVCVRVSAHDLNDEDDNEEDDDRNGTHDNADENDPTKPDKTSEQHSPAASSSALSPCYRRMCNVDDLMSKIEMKLNGRADYEAIKRAILLPRAAIASHKEPPSSPIFCHISDFYDVCVIYFEVFFDITSTKTNTATSTTAATATNGVPTPPKYGKRCVAKE
ncbi:hypothetical protein HELRODRAFT_159277 [Helobdella robusta]|uniref:Uncharacterized protein n=1 Tax=Helobdella robusta TaxID=6412 RepID=T1ENT5_HELRO|nr:hypothetical protein HELRODRAFT_159277 [Helobdella robusta]ESO12693.1 hypothetical protein HELRODRAFT_159277 [Helobdella robusta]